VYFASTSLKTSHVGKCIRHTLGKYYYIGCILVPFVYEDEHGILQVGQAEQLRIVPPGNIIYHGALADGLPFSDTFIYVGGDDVRHTLERWPLPLIHPFTIKKHHILHDYIERLLDERNQKLPGYEDKIHHILNEMFIDLHRSYIQTSSKSMQMERVEVAHMRMIQNITHDWTLQELSDISGYSSSRFSSLYLERYGTSPIEQLISMRIQAAKDLLKNSNKSITDIAEETGFSSIHYFSRKFKSVTGMTPTEYTRKYRPDT
jgi:AraC-like DNA-binding protein